MSLAARKAPGYRPLCASESAHSRGKLMGARAPGPLLARVPEPFVAWDDEPLEELDAFALFLRLQHQDVAPSKKVEILDELSFRERDIPSSLLSELLDRMQDAIPPPGATESPEGAWLSSLVNETVRAKVAETFERARLSVALLRIAVRWLSLGSAEDPCLWTAIRRGSSLLRPEEMDAMLVFLAPERPLSIHQVAIQAVEAKSTVIDDELPTSVRDRVGELALEYVDKAISGDAGATIDAIAAGAVAASALARVSTLPQMVKIVVQSCPPRVRWLVGVLLTRAVEHRKSVRPGAPAIPGVMDAITALQSDAPVKALERE